MSPIELSEGGTASRLPAAAGLIRIDISGPQVGSWAIDHLEDDLSPFGFFVVGGGPEYMIHVAGRRRCGPAYLDGHLELGLVVDRGEFANSFEAAQIAIERLAQLPDARYLARASLRIEVEEGR